MRAIHLPLGQPLEQAYVQPHGPGLLTDDHRTQLSRISTNGHVRRAAQRVVGGDDREGAGEIRFRGLRCFVDEEEAKVGFGERNGGLRVDGAERVHLEGGEVLVGAAGREEEGGVED